jgi:hypothetical protein
MITHCITLRQVKEEASRRAIEDGVPRKVYVRKRSGRLLIRVHTDPIFVCTEAELICFVCPDGKVINIK